MSGFMKRRRPPEHIRNMLDYGYTVEGQTIDILEIRPVHNLPQTMIHGPIARIRFLRNQGHWKLYWMRADMKWHSYPPDPVHATLESALAAIEKDSCCCFFG